MNVENIYIGNQDIASQITDLKEVFKREFDLDTFTVNDQQPYSIVQAKVDLNLYKYKNIFPLFKPRRISSIIKPFWDQFVAWIFLKLVIDKHDVFIFIWSTLYANNKDLEILKKRGKKIIICYVGSDARWHYGQKQEFNSYGLRHLKYEGSAKSLKHLKKLTRHLRMAEKNADMIFSRLDQHQLGLRPYYRWHMMVDFKKYEDCSTQRKDYPIVVHAPSHRGMKGSQYVIDVLDKLKKENVPFKFVLVENVPNEKAKELYRDADIIIDQLICPGSGKLSTEGLAYGKVVLSHMAYDNYPQNTELPEYPIVDVNPDTLYEILKDLILDFEKRQTIANKARVFVKGNLDYVIFCQKIIDYLSGEKIKFDYTPTFFRENYSPISKEETAEHNKWLSYVRECDWYAEYVRSGERNGLKF